MLVLLQLIACDITEILDDCVVVVEIDDFGVEPVLRPELVTFDFDSFGDKLTEPLIFKTISDVFISNLSAIEKLN